MALLLECTQSFAQKVFDTADIVRDAMLQQLSGRPCSAALSRSMGADVSHFSRMKSTRTWVRIFTGIPRIRSGLYRHCRTASNADSMSNGLPESTLKLRTVPSFAIRASRITCPESLHFEPVLGKRVEPSYPVNHGLLPQRLSLLAPVPAHQAVLAYMLS